MYMRFVVKRPGKEIEFADVAPENVYDFLKEQVDGYLEHVSLSDEHTSTGALGFYCNDEGKLLDLPYNFTLDYSQLYSGGRGVDDILGTVVFTSLLPSGDAGAVTDKQLAFILKVVA
jgi:hypothetical protein